MMGRNNVIGLIPKAPGSLFRVISKFGQGHLNWFEKKKLKKNHSFFLQLDVLKKWR
jgi:hypothetical protein